MSINVLNTILILVAYGLAYVIPFELFIVTYAILGPLHYLTEIPWLQRKGYFVESAQQTWWFWLLAIAATVVTLTHVVYGFAHISFIAFGSALVMVLTPDRNKRIVGIALVAALSFIVRLTTFTEFLFGLYLTTLIHVLVFTWLFMLLGSLKEKKLSGYISVATLTVCALSFLVMPQSANGYKYAPYFAQSAEAFGYIEKRLSNLLGWTNDYDSFVAAMRLVAFAYTYHYLNWFSKTRIIQWHKMPVRTMVLIGLLYTASMAVYAYDFRIGLNVLLFLSVAHVYLEFPLNWRSFQQISRELFATRIGKQPVPRGVPVQSHDPA
ncbi:MAG: hypothetical protein K2X93_23825 [Candidatus Obscuribacterales bacterium]|nr:hypothetical protein [Candidatus Obscuribacterales bacterium]